MLQYRQGTLIRNRVWMKRRNALASDATSHSNNFCHPAHDDQQQQQQAAAAAAAATVTAVQAGIYKYILVRRPAAYSILIIYRRQVNVLCCERCLRNKKRKYSNNNTEQQQQRRQHYIKLTYHVLDCSDDTSVIHTRYSVCIFTLEQKKRNVTHKKQKTPPTWIRTTDA